MMECISCRREIPEGAIFCQWCGRRQVAAPPVQRKKRRRPKGSGSVYKLKDRNRERPWIAMTGKGETLGMYSTSGEAVQALDAYNSQNVPLARLKYRFSDVYQNWSEVHYKRVGEDGRNSYELAYRKAESLWSRPIRELVTEDYQVIINQLVSAGLSRSMCEKQKQLFSQLCKWSMANGIISHNFAEELVLPPVPKKKTLVIKRDEIARIQAIADDRKDPMNEVAKIAIVLYYTGMRINELLTLRREDVDLKNGYIVGGEKSDAGRERTIPILGSIKLILGDWMLDSIGNDLLLPSKKTGGKRSDSDVEKKFKQLMRRCNINEKAVPHTMRRTATTRLVEGKAEPTAVKEIMGHSNFSTTADYYTSHDEEYLKSEMEKFNG